MGVYVFGVFWGVFGVFWGVFWGCFGCVWGCLGVFRAYGLGVFVFRVFGCLRFMELRISVWGFRG